MKDEQSKARMLTRQRIYLIWETKKKGEKLDSEGELTFKILKQHPEYEDVWAKADDLGDAEFTRDGMNPFMHVAVHQVVENQLSIGEPPEVIETLNRLREKGVDRHETIHRIGKVVTEEIFDVLKEGKSFDRKRYTSKLCSIE